MNLKRKRQMYFNQHYWGYEMQLSIDEYKPYKGFYDLREFKLAKRKFHKLWRIQDRLHEMEENKTYYQKWHPAQWGKAKEVSAGYQALLREV